MATNYDQLVKDAYASIGRTGVGTGANQIDQGGLDYWTSQLQSGAINPADLQSKFGTAVNNYIAEKPTDAVTQHVQSYKPTASTPTPASSYTPTQIADYYKSTVGAGGMTEAQFVEQARAAGIGDSALLQARQTLLGGGSGGTPPPTGGGLISSAALDPWASYAPVSPAVNPSAYLAAIDMSPTAMVNDAYNSIGRFGMGTNPGQIDLQGYKYWTDQLKSGAIAPKDFRNTFNQAVGAYQTEKPGDAVTGYTTGFKNSTLAEKQRVVQDYFDSRGLPSDSWDRATAGGMYNPNGSKALTDQYNSAMANVGRYAPPADAVYRAKAAFDPTMNKNKGGIGIIGPDGVVRPAQIGLGENAYHHLDRMGVDPASYAEAVRALLASPYYAENYRQPDRERYLRQAEAYNPRFATGADASLIRQGLDPTVDASPFFGNYQTPNTKEFMDRAGVDFKTASSMLYSSGQRFVGDALIDWDKVMASPDPARALIAARNALAADPKIAAWIDQANREDYRGWNTAQGPVVDPSIGVASGGVLPGGRPGVPGGAGGVGGVGGVGGGGAMGGAPGAPGTGSMAPTGFQSWQVTPEQTVEQRAANLIQQDSPLMQQARGRAMQQMNERGLINSSLAQQASMEAVLGRAEGIAGADAATFARAGEFNTGQANAWNLAQQELSQDRYKFDRNLDQDMQKFGMDLEFRNRQLAQSGSEFAKELTMRQDQFGQELAYKYATLQADADNRLALMEAENRYQAQLENDQAFNKQYQMYVDAIYQIDKDKDLGEEAKLQAKFQQARMLEDYARLRGLNLNMDFSSRFKPAGT
jgi:hypothetical protein